MFEDDSDLMNLRDWVALPPSTIQTQSLQKKKVQRTVQRFEMRIVWVDR